MLQKLLFLGILICGAAVAADVNCGDPFVNGVGPWDYRDQEARSNFQKIPIVERHHFTPKVEQLIHGEAQVDPAGDIDYVLRAVPNHHRALYAISRYEKARGPISKKWRSADCYFDRAMRFRPDDAIVRMIYGVHLATRDRHKDAVLHYEQALSQMPDSPELNYNLGLSLVALGEYEKAGAVAKTAYDNGYPLQGLRRKLAQHGIDLETGPNDASADTDSSDN